MNTALQSKVIELPDDDPWAVYERLYEMGVPDGLPVIAPTDARVRQFVAASGRPANEVVGRVAPLQGPATVEKIAINAVMAGCRPEYMPVVIAAVEAVCDPAFNLLAVQTTTNPVAPLILVNGPIRQQLDINCGRDALGPGRRANATIGRTMRLIQLNVGGAVPGEVDKSTLGMPGKYTMCLGELEEESPWKPMHVDRGLRREESAVTVVGVHGTDNTFVAWREADSILQAVASAMTSIGAINTVMGNGNCIVFFNPGHAKLLADQGFSKQDVQDQLYARSRIPVGDLPQEVSEIQDDRYRHVVDGFNTVTRSPRDILIAVAGGPEAYHITYCAGFGHWAVTKPVRMA